MDFAKTLPDRNSNGRLHRASAREAEAAGLPLESVERRNSSTGIGGVPILPTRGSRRNELKFTRANTMGDGYLQVPNFSFPKGFVSVGRNNP